MREIKFRAWNNVEKLLQKDIDFIDWKDKQIGYYGINDCPLEHVIIQQYTGLKDKNGKEIYEGDIVLWKQADGGLLPPTDSQYTCQIKWVREGWVCEDLKVLKDNYHSCFTLASSHIEIIGNIYENPDLLKD